MHLKKKKRNYILYYSVSKIFKECRQSGKNAILNDFTDYRIRYISSITQRMQIKSTIDMAFLSLVTDRSSKRVGHSEVRTHRETKA